MEAVLELRGVTKDFPGHRAVDGVNLQIPRGAFFSLVGPSGSGKTTTLRLIAGFEQPTSGEIWLNGRPIHHLKPYERPVSTVFQSYALFPHLTVRGNVEFGLRQQRVPEAARRLREALEMVQLVGKESRYPSELSGGERQRVALARSLVVEPDVLLLDEPLSALDPALRKQMRSELKNVQRRAGITFLLVTHDCEEALSLSDRVALINQGRIEQVGAPEEVYRRPKTRFVAGFLGPVNWIGEIGIRPEATRLSRQAPDGGVRTAPATVTESVFLGNRVHVRARLGTGEEIIAEVSHSDGLYRTGEAVHVWWRPEEELRFDGA
ncbi:MAG: ABC transporter ATP-binding protein [Bryobacterales bacterium]|nr:ABC transporter ATP-binding protein [Bryobacteraceae bacterium]MDW8353810.1 ABC transporter ATP-binding protein [Bryobacterales bacterium]